MSISQKVIRKIIFQLVSGQDYRMEVLSLINSSFLQHTIDFFKTVIDAKIENKDLTLDWYRSNFVSNPNIEAKERALNAGINKKTIHNMKRSSTKAVVINAAEESYDQLTNVINELIDDSGDLDVNIILKFNKASVELTLNESLIVINALAVKRAELRGGLWSTAGKRVEVPLVYTLCKLFKVPEENYQKLPDGKYYRNIELTRQIDSYINHEGKTFYKCEVKLMGKGNPESADAAYARDTHIFIADTLSEKNKVQFNLARKEWVELHTPNGYQRFNDVLNHLDIPHKNFSGGLIPELNLVLDDIFSEIE